MLKKLSVQNFVLIDKLEISFEKGLTIITGETGAGKSILLGALNLILGHRADSRALQSPEKKCVVEARFDISNYSLQSFFTENDLDYDAETSVRREITPEGKSRAFINDTPVNLTQLKEFTSGLVDIHSQHETLLLNEGSFQLSVTDAYAGNDELLNSYKDVFHEFNSLRHQLAETIEKEEKAGAESDYMQFQLNELNEAALTEGEQERLEEEQDKLTHAEEIILQLNRAEQLLADGEENLLSGLANSRQLIQTLSAYGNSYNEIAERLSQAYVELKDIAAEIEHESSKVQADPSRLETVQDRLALIYRLQQKHRCNSVSELLAISENLQSRLSGINSLEEEVILLKKQIEVTEHKLSGLAEKLSSKRSKAAPLIEAEVKKLLADLAMPHARLKIELITAEKGTFYKDGTDKIRFLFAANKGSDFREIQKSASGGELSRIMLCIKSIQAKVSQMPTLIFDEIDTGISGETAAKAGWILKLMSDHHQLFCITHLPQIAARGNSHLNVYKETSGQKTFTRLRTLAEDEKVKEVARLLSGEQLTAAALENARELIDQ